MRGVAEILTLGHGVIIKIKVFVKLIVIEDSWKTICAIVVMVLWRGCPFH